MRRSPEKEPRGREMGEMRDEQFKRRDNRRIKRRGEKRERRMEERNERSYHSSQPIRRSRERSLGRPVRGFINTISGGFFRKRVLIYKKSTLEKC